MYRQDCIVNTVISAYALLLSTKPNQVSPNYGDNALKRWELSRLEANNKASLGATCLCTTLSFVMCLLFRAFLLTYKDFNNGILRRPSHKLVQCLSNEWRYCTNGISFAGTWELTMRKCPPIIIIVSNFFHINIFQRFSHIDEVDWFVLNSTGTLNSDYFFKKALVKFC